FDRSAFHQRERFNLLSTSQLQTCCRNRKLSVVHTPIFIEETVRMYGNQQSREHLRHQLPFIFYICNGRVYYDTETIWKCELVLNYRRSTDIFFPRSRWKPIEQSIRTGILTDDWSEWQYSLWDEMNAKKQVQHDTFKEIRQSVSDNLSFKDLLYLTLD